MKRSQNTDLDELLDSLADGDDAEPKPEHDAWADLYEAEPDGHAEHDDAESA
ncbi:MAG: hypothetical protein HKN26_14020 [Acidimicrobiales bacterium]|nr:hypothetical protein [Acidimicrobiales bacterium]